MTTFWPLQAGLPLKRPLRAECVWKNSRDQLTSDMDIRLTPKAEIPQAAELELRDEDMDVYYYDGDEIDLDPFIYEEVLLNMPLRPICKDECQGLCAICGKNKNLETCDCHETSRTLLGEKLKSFLN